MQFTREMTLIRNSNNYKYIIEAVWDARVEVKPAIIPDNLGTLFNDTCVMTISNSNLCVKCVNGTSNSQGQTSPPVYQSMKIHQSNVHSDTQAPYKDDFVP